MANYLNTRFNLTFVQDTIKLAFVAPLNETIYINSNLFYIAACPISVDYVDLGEFDAGITTVNWSLCNTIGGGDRTTWIAAVLASIVVPNNAPTSLAASALTDSVVGYNGTTHQFTDLGNAPQHRFYVYSTVAQAVAAAGTTILYNTIVADPMSGYNAATGIYTVPYAGNWSFGFTGSTNNTNAGAICINGANQVTNGISWATWAPGWGIGNAVTYYCNAGDTVRMVFYVTAATLSNAGKLNNFWGKRVV